METLFQSSSNQVVQYANNAYKTAGLSANEYMETVTSFSASLLQSLNGDTAKAAAAADLAITDMSDNANKMGSDMESIQNAYQGFAKQNYTMLDNLKLGYGGTKEEMQRLLSDAEKLSGQKFDLSSYSDIIEAIHAVQTEMGITGTTAQEASSTIQGSLDSMKSAWGNLVTGLAGDSRNLDQLIGNFAGSVATAGKNLIPRVEQALSGIGSAIQALAPVIVEQVPPLVESVLPSLLSAGGELLSGLTNGIIAAAPGLIESGIPVIASLVDGITSALPELAAAALEIIVSLAEGLIKALPKLAERVPQIIANIVTTLASNLPQITEAALRIIVTLAEGLIKAIPQLVKSVPQLVASIVEGFTANGPKFLDIGKNIVSGVWQGIQNMGAWIKEKVSGFFSGIVDGVKGVLGIHSPSKVFAGIGGYMAQGLGEGFGDELGTVERNIKRSMAELAGNASGRIQVSGSVTGPSGGDMGNALAQLPVLIAAAVHAEFEGMAVNLNQRKVGELTSRWQANQVRAMGV